MSNLTARQYQINDLKDIQLIELHDFEKERGIVISPWEINEKYNLGKHGERPPGEFEPIEKAVWAIFFKERVNYTEEKQDSFVYEEFLIIHRVDISVRKQKLGFMAGDPTARQEREDAPASRIQNQRKRYPKN